MVKNNKIATVIKLIASLFEEHDKLKNISYREYLYTTHWKQMKTIKLRDADYRCQVCYSPKSLQVHHRTYERLGYERLTDLTVLCKECHELFHTHRTLDKSYKKGYNKKGKDKK